MQLVMVSGTVPSGVQLSQVPNYSPVINMANGTYTFILPSESYFTIYTGIPFTGAATINPPGGYFINIIQTPVAAGGGRVVDIDAVEKPKLRKTSIRIKKVKKGTRAAKR